tara:strand:+ start:900 stop:1097 length:198 start_codon:yes stop_codon:yes gene_type:complete
MTNVSTKTNQPDRAKSGETAQRHAEQIHIPLRHMRSENVFANTSDTACNDMQKTLTLFSPESSAC